MKKAMGAAALAFTLVVASAGMATAEEKTNNGNHQAVWSLDAPLHGQDEPGDWGPWVSGFASGGAFKGVGVSCGVHDYKDLKEKEKCE